MMLSRGHTLFRAGDVVDSLFIVESGRLTLESPTQGGVGAAGTGNEGGGQGGNSSGQTGPVRVMEFGPGCLVGAQVGICSRKFLHYRLQLVVCQCTCQAEQYSHCHFPLFSVKYEIF